MPKAKVTRKMARAIEANRLSQRADKEWSRGRLRSAFRLFLAAAKAGVAADFRVVAQFYDIGEGVKANQEAALYWYRRAARDGDYSAANNIGCIWRDRNKLSQALFWLKRAVKLGDGDANLNIAKIYFHKKHDVKKAIRYLKATCRAGFVTEGSKEEARLLLRQLTKKRAEHA